MASIDSAYTTGAAHDEADPRRRNVSSYEKTNGKTVYSVEAEDTKKLAKKVNTDCCHFLTGPLMFIPQQSKSFIQLLDEWEFIIAPVVFTAFALFTRLWRIGLSPIVTWDEAQ
jgi:dolichyl-phosphate-mannose-protein mannosyltransferase